MPLLNVVGDALRRAKRTYWEGPDREATVPAMFDFESSQVPIRGEIASEFRNEWERLANPGPTWSGAERVAIALAAREGSAEGLPEEAVRASHRITRDPVSLDRGWVEEAAEALGMDRYLELVGVVARLAAVDFFHHSLGLEVESLPEPLAGDPTGEVDDRARPGKAWVPMVGGSSIVGALSMVPSEAKAQEQLHGPIYLTYDGMADLDFQRGLHRSQMELVAARTSAINECFY